MSAYITPQNQILMLTHIDMTGGQPMRLLILPNTYGRFDTIAIWHLQVHNDKSTRLARKVPFNVYVVSLIPINCR